MSEKELLTEMSEEELQKVEKYAHAIGDVFSEGEEMWIVMYSLKIAYMAMREHNHPPGEENE